MNATLPAASGSQEIDPRVHIGHVHLKVADLRRSLNFYSGILGLEMMQRMGDSAAFLSAGGYHHHIAINTWESLGGSPPPAGTTGLITPPSSIRRGRSWRMLCGGFSLLESRSKAPPTMESASRFICATRMTMVWNSIAINHARAGREARTGSLRCIPILSICNCF